MSERSILDRGENCSTYFENFKNLIRPGDNQKLFDFNFNTGKSKYQKNIFPFKEYCKQIFFEFSSRIPSVSLAFSILVHNNVGIFEILLHMLFHPSHSYCVHIDVKANQVVRNATQAIVKCFKASGFMNLDQEFWAVILNHI